MYLQYALGRKRINSLVFILLILTFGVPLLILAFRFWFFCLMGLLVVWQVKRFRDANFDYKLFFGS